MAVPTALPQADMDNDRLDGPVLDVYLLGLLRYEDALRLQRRLVYEVSGSGGQAAALVLCEHHPIISVGRSGSRSHIDCDDGELRARRLAVRWVNRGGGCMLHIPGQLAVYPIWPFHPHRLDFCAYMDRLEHCLLRVLDEFDIRGFTRPGHPGIWTCAGQIASIGISVSRWVSYFGMTLNVSGVRDQFRILHPEGNGSLHATTMEAVRQRPAPMAKVRECMVSQFVESFQPARYNLYTQHTMLGSAERSRIYARSG
jgi:lipoyl(octanoyl) transferase